MKLFLIFVLAASAAIAQTPSISGCAISAGLSDATISGAYNVAPVNAQYVFSVSAAGTPDNFTWAKNGGASSSQIAMTGAAQSFSDGLSIKFAATTGHTLGATCTVTVTINEPSASMSTMQRGIGAVPRTVQDKLRDTVNVKDFGAKCDGGITDDRVAIQAAIDAVGGGTVNFPNGTACGASDPGVLTYPANKGITLHCPAYSFDIDTYIPGAGGCLVAYAASPPVALLTNMAERSHLENLVLDCNAGAATYGLVDANADRDVEEKIITAKCSGDGERVWNEGTPSTTISGSSIIAAGSTTFPVHATTINRITFGQGFCGGVTVDAGTSSQEQFGVASIIPGTSVTVSSVSVFPHSPGAIFQCHGHSNELQISRYYSYENGGWGFRVIPGSDTNGIEWRNGNSNGNALGGERWQGAAQKHYGGDYEADGGPAIQLGGTDGQYSTAPGVAPDKADGYFGPIGDMEEAQAQYDAVWAVCTYNARIDQSNLLRLHIATGSDACAVQASGPPVIGVATDQDMNGVPSFVLSNANGIVPVSVYPSNQSGQCAYPGQIAIIPSATVATKVQQQCVGAGIFTISAGANANPVVLTSTAWPPLLTSGGYLLFSGFKGKWAPLNGIHRETYVSSTTASIAGIDSTTWGTLTGSPTYTYGIWSSTSGGDIHGPLTVEGGINYIDDSHETGTTDHPAGVAINSQGGAVTLHDGMLIFVQLAHAVAANGSVDFTYNGHTAVIRNVFDGSPISNPLAVHMPMVLYYNGSIDQFGYLSGGQTTLTAGSGITLSGSSGAVTISSTSASAITALIGDVTASGPGSAAATLATSGVSAGTYGSNTQVGAVSVDAKGRVTSAGNVSISGVTVNAGTGLTGGGTAPPGGSVTISQASVNGHTLFGGTTPTLSSCGTSPSIGAGASDNAASVTLGSGGVTACTVTFGTGFSHAPACTVAIVGSTPIVPRVSVSTSAVTVTFSTSPTGFDMNCF